MSMKKRLIKTLREQANYHRKVLVPDHERRSMHDFFAIEYDRLAKLLEGESDE